MNAGAARELCVPLGENGAGDARVAGRQAASSRGLRDGEILTVDGAASLVRILAGWHACEEEPHRGGEVSAKVPLARIPSRTAVERSKRLRDAETASLRSRMTCRHDLIGDR